MKIYILLILGVYSVLNGVSQNLLTIGKTPITKKEFLKAYLKNNGNSQEKRLSIQEYLDLYTRFKLKVQEAKDLGYDTLPQIIYETQAFRNQIADNYLNDEKLKEQMITEAFVRMKKDRNALLIFVPKASDTARQYKGINELAANFAKATNNYEKIVNEYNSKYFAKATYYDLNWITAFTTSYEFENAIYKLKPGQVSAPITTAKGTYLFKLLAERKAVGTWKISQILIANRLGEGFDKANDIYNKIMNGEESFENLASKFSYDRISGNAKGEMPDLTVGQYDKTFEDEVYKLKNDGDITKPFLTELGYHIVRRNSVSEIPDNFYQDGFNNIVKQKVLNDPRSLLLRDKFVERISKQVFQKQEPINEKYLQQLTDTALAKPNLEAIENLNLKKQKLFSVGNGKDIVTATSRDYMMYVNNLKNSGQYKFQLPKDLLKGYLNLVTLEYYKNRLEKYDEEFAYQVKEFLEGNLLFEIMEKKVWGRAGTDTVGLKRIYEQNKSKYLWDKSALALIVTSSDVDKLREALTKVRNGFSTQDIQDNALSIDSSRVEIGQLPIANNKLIVDGYISDILTNIYDGSSYFVKIYKTYPSGEIRSFEEAKGYAINDYQVLLEENWIKELRKKYPVVINKMVEQQMIKESQR